MRSTRTVLFCLLGMATLAAATQVADAQQAANDPALLDNIVSRMEQAQQRNRDNYRAYTMTREYKLYGAQENKPKSEVIADVNFVPPDRKTFKIEKTEGNDRGISVVRHVLEHESQAAAAQTAPGAIDRHNYDFKLLGEGVMDGQPCWTLQLLPKRDEKTLIRGTTWVDKNTYLIHKIQGELAKSPSWWLKKVETTIQFGSAAGMWLQTQTRAEADVRMFGHHIFTAQAIRLQTAGEVATRFSSASPTLTVAMSSHGVNGYAAVPHVRQANGGQLRTTAARHRPTRPVPPLIGAGMMP